MSIYAPMMVIGGSGGGTWFSDYGADGKLLEKIGVWAGGWQIKAMKIWRTGEAAKTFGNPSGPYREYAFQPGERITNMSLWGNGAGTRLGWIYFKTSKGGKFDFGMTEWGKKQEYPIDPGSGICVGVQGRSGSDIDAGGFVFLSDIRSSILKDVRYPTLSFDMAGITPRVLDSYKNTNTGSSPRDWEFSGSSVVSTSETWELTVGLEVYSEISVQAGVPEVASVDGKFGWKVSATASHQTTQDTSRSLSWKDSGTLYPGDSVNLQAIIRIGTLSSIDYTGTMEITMKSGEKFSYPVSSSYKGVTCTSVEIIDTGLRGIHESLWVLDK